MQQLNDKLIKATRENQLLQDKATSANPLLNYTRRMVDARNREFDQAMSLIIDELKMCQKSLRGNILMQLIEKILAVQKENALNYSGIEEAAAQ